MANIKLDHAGFLMGFGIALFGVGVIAFLRLNKKHIDEELAEEELIEEGDAIHFNNRKDLCNAKKIIYNENYKTIDKSEQVPYHLIGINGSKVAMPGEAEDIDLDEDPAESEAPTDDVEPEIYDEEKANEESYYNPVEDYNDDSDAIEYEDIPEEEVVQAFPERDIPTEYPYEISFEEYEYAQKDGTGPEQETLTYYPADEILVNEDRNEIIRNPGSLIGGSTLLAIKSNKSKVTYIRNTKLNIDYEIYCERGHYEGDN